MTTIPAGHQTEPFRCEVAPERELVRVVPVGELDLSTAEQVRDRLAEMGDAGFSDIVLDLRQLTFLDSTGLRLVLSHCGVDYGGHDASDGGAVSPRVDLIAGPPQVQRVFELSGVLDRLPLREPR